MRYLLMILCAVVGLQQVSCNRQLKAPPVVPVAFSSPVTNGLSFKGQGILVENRLLTAMHIFTTKPGGAFPPETLTVSGALTGCSPYAHGDLEIVEGLYHPDRQTRLSGLGEDWLALEIDSLPPVSAETFTVRGAVQGGEKVFAIRAINHDGVLRYEYTPLVILSFQADEPVPEGLILAENLDKTSLKSWSGCFVGRYNENASTWELFGILISTTTQDGRQIHSILRPPARALSWLTGD